MLAEKSSQPENTREKIIKCGAEIILYTGFQSASIGEILNNAGVSKGCFYHHFPTKIDLGYAIIDELFTRVTAEIWEPILNSNNPLQSIIDFYKQQANNLNSDQIKHGCPINNLAQEMSPVDEGFRKRIEKFYSIWRKRLAKELKRCQKDGHMQKNINTNEVASLIIAVTQGAIGIAKNAQNVKIFSEYTKGMTRYLNSLQT